MLTQDRKFDFIGELTIHRSQVQNAPNQPRDDKVNWLFLRVGQQQLSFVYKMEAPLEAAYNVPFRAYLAFTMAEVARVILQVGNVYEVLRGQETIGTVKLLLLLADS